MPRKRYSDPERTLTSVLHLLEQDDITSARVALSLLFSHGPLEAPDFFADVAVDADLITARNALREMVRWLAVQPGVPLKWTLTAPLTFGFVMAKRRPVLGLYRPDAFTTAALVDASRLVFFTAAREVGLANLVPCAAPDCAHTIVRFHKRTFCSPTCQKRTYMRVRRDNERIKRARRRRLHVMAQRKGA
jgi:hypothetical protein